MQYHVIHIKTDFAEEWQKDLFEQQLFDLGCDTIDGNDCYIQSELWLQNADEIKSLCTATEGATLLSVEKCPDENWNAVWEAEHPIQELPLGVKIIPHCAFGATSLTTELEPVFWLSLPRNKVPNKSSQSILTIRA